MNQFAILRPAISQDCEDIHSTHLHAVQYACIRSYNEQVLKAWESLLDLDNYFETLADPRKALWVVEYNDRIQGFFQLDIKEAQLDALYVHPLFHNQGLGTALLCRAEQIAAAAGLSFLKLYASLNSVPFYLLNHYESLGEAVLQLNQTVQVKSVLMRKNLSAHL